MVKARQILEHLGFKPGKNSSVMIQGKHFDRVVEEIDMVIAGQYKTKTELDKIAQKEATKKVVERERVRQQTLAPERKKKAGEKEEAEKKKARPNPKEMADKARAKKVKVKKVVVKKAKKK